MKKLVLTFIFLLLIIPAFSQNTDDVSNKFIKILEPMVNDTLNGFNTEKSDLYFKHFAKAMTVVATKKVFDSMVLGMWKKNLGNFKSMTIVKSKCSFNEGFPLLVYKGVFEKNKKMMIVINFMKEKDEYKIMQFRIDPQK